MLRNTRFLLLLMAIHDGHPCFFPVGLLDCAAHLAATFYPVLCDIIANCDFNTVKTNLEKVRLKCRKIRYTMHTDPESAALCGILFFCL